MISQLDRGFTLGDGLFETVLWTNGQLYLWPQHMQRLANGCAALGLPHPDPALCEQAARDEVAKMGLEGGRVAVRISWTAGVGGRGLERPTSLIPRLIVQAAPAPRPVGAARLVTSSIRRNEGSPVSRLKSLSYLDPVLARREALAQGADEAVMLNNQGRLACAAAANILWMSDGALHTPDLSCGVLAGVMRDALLAAAGAAGMPVREVGTTPDALTGADSVWLSNALIGIRPVANLDGHPLRQHAVPDALVAAARRFAPD